MDAHTDDNPNAQLVTFGKRDPMTSLERRAPPRMGARSYDSHPWKHSPIHSNGIRDGSSQEREHFLPPVRLDPGFDGLAEFSAAVSQASDTSRLIKEMEKCPPKDRYKFIYIIMLIHGIAALIPWNMFINAKSYFEDYKLNQGNSSSEALIDYRINFMSYIGMASQYPGFAMNMFNLFVQCGSGNLGVRVLTGIIISVLMFIFTVALAMMDSSTWPELFFWLTIGSVIILSAGVGIYQNSMFGIVAILPMKYTNAIIFGNNISGTFVAVLNLAMMVVSPNQKIAAVYYFVTAIAVLLIAFDAYFLTPHSKFYRHYQKLHQLKKQEHAESTASNPRSQSCSTMLQSFRRVFGQIWHLLFGVWFTFFITLLLFPTVMSDVKPMQIDMEGNYWTSIFCFLFFNFFAAAGNLMTEFVKWPSDKWINILIVARIVFVPLFVLGNFRPDARSMPVYIEYDSIFIASAILFSFSSGYLSSLVMMYGPKRVRVTDAPIAGMMMALFLLFGILSGINASRAWSCIIDKC